MTDLVTKLERRLGFSLPDDYRQFLQNHTNSALDPARVFNSPRSGIVDQLLTVDQLLKNDELDRIGIPEQSLLHIGSNFLGGYLYLRGPKRCQEPFLTCEREDGGHVNCWLLTSFLPLNASHAI